MKATPTKLAKLSLMKQKGDTNTEISEELGISVRAVQYNWKRMQQTSNPYAKRPYKGRKRRFTPRKLRRAARMIRSGEARDASDVQRQAFPDFAPETVRERLRSIGLNGRIRRKKPFLTKKQIRQRRIWAAVHGDWSLQDWKAVAFSDESKFNLFGSDGKRYCRRSPGEEFLPRNVKQMVKHGGGSVMVWGCVTWNGMGRLHRIEGNMTAAMYCDILEENLRDSFQRNLLDVEDVIFQQDNDPKHTSKAATAWFEEQKLEVLAWPSQSPDMNIIEHVWDMLDIRVRARKPLPQNTEQFWAALEEEWYNFPLEQLRHLYESMPRRVAALQEAKGFWTKY